MGKPKAPTPPDPKQTSAASTSTNIGTAVANAWMGNVSENTADGSTKVTQTGSQTWVDPYTGQNYAIPTFTRETTLSPQQQAIKDQQDKASLNLSSLGNTLSGKLGSQLTDNFKLGNDATEARLMELGRRRLDPLLAQQDEATRTRLANSGFAQGSEGWNREMDRSAQNRNDAYTQLLLTGRNQANQELLTEDNQRINQISALMNGGQVSQPNFMGANMPTIPTTDVAGLINENYNQKMGAYNQQMAAKQGVLGGLFGLGSSLIMASDRRVKRDVRSVGSFKGHKLYEYQYKGKFDDGERHVGVMAQEAEKKRPDAVMTGTDGVKRVDYGRLFDLGARIAA